MSLRSSSARVARGPGAHEPARGGPAVRISTGAIRLYRYLISPALPPRCRYLPTCSAYALEAIEQHGALAGGWLALKRVGRCHPLGGAGLDPVPPRRPAAAGRP